MQYILLPDENHRYFLADRNEQVAINNGITQTLDTESETLSLRLMYGVYKPQIDNHFTLADIQDHIGEALGQWLSHIQNTTVMKLRILSIILSDRSVSDLTHREYWLDGRPTQDMAFAALIEAPTTFEIDEQHRQARTAYLQDNPDPIATLKNRKGLFAFSGEEKRFGISLEETPLTEKNWTSRINYFRVLNEVRRVQ